jgi:hypothetical protein
MANELIRPIDADTAHAIGWPRQPSVGFSSDGRLIAALPRTATGGITKLLRRKNGCPEGPFPWGKFV